MGPFHRLFSKRGAGGPPPEALAFQDDLEALVAEPAPLMLRLWPALTGGMVLALVALASVVRLDVVVTAEGRLASLAPPVVLQPFGSAMLREMRVQPGDAVRAGDVVALLDSTFTAADREALESQRRALSARRDRLETELAGRHGLEPASGGVGGPEAALQDDLRTQRRAVRDARRTSIEADLASIESAMTAEAGAGAGLMQRLALAREIEEMRATLEAREVGSRLALLAARDARLNAEEELRRHAARLEELRHRRDARKAELAAFVGDWERQLIEELAQVRPEIERLDEALAKATRLDALTELRAPRDGVVVEVARRSPGSLMREGEPVVTLVPTGVPLIAEISLKSSEIGRLSTGASATVKVDSFPWRRHGALPGELRSISRESYATQSDGGGAVVHKGQIRLVSEELANMPAGAQLLPGMTLSADVNVGTRTVLEFFVEPLVRGLKESLREP